MKWDAKTPCKSCPHSKTPATPDLDTVKRKENKKEIREKWSCFVRAPSHPSQLRFVKTKGNMEEGKY
jgi:hypothetical protein